MTTDNKICTLNQMSSWQYDESLCRADKLIELSSGRVRAVSFDFFDTLVWRLVAKPVDAFREVGRRLRQKEMLRSTISADDFETLRRLAEYKTRERQALKDATLEDIHIREIYQQMDSIVTDPAAGVEIEHGVESDLCMLNPVMAGFIHHLRQRGLRVLVVSDIYFSGDHLRRILLANQFDPSIFDAMLTSCDADVCKGTGNLFRHALKTLNLEADQMLHIGDNPAPDVVGARKAGVRGCHYQQATQETNTILEREKFLLGGQNPVFNANSLRMLAARAFPENTDEGSFGRMGALLLGPVLTRFATWACDQYLASGVRKVGAFMREGELFAQILQCESDVRGLDLEIKPLYINRKATALAALGGLTADGVIDWLVRRSTLPVKTILAHFGIAPESARHLPFSLEEKTDSRERVLQLAKFLFSPEIASRIEARSAEERRKVLDYLRPWLESGDAIGLCDIGYNASAQTQLKRIFDLESNRTHMVGCYLLTGEGSAARILESLDVRHYLGSFGRPEHLYHAFLRSPAFVEQSFVAPVGTTLGYTRQPDGKVTPVLDEVRFDEATMRRQRRFKEGVALFQNLWHWFRATKPGLLDGKTELSQRILEDVDCGFTPILGRAAAFPTQAELAIFGSLPLDDYYFADSFKPMCGASDREKLRKQGYARILGEAGIHWPQGVFQMENPRAASEFFSCGKAMLLCNSSGDKDGVQPELVIVVPPQRDTVSLRKCLNQLKPVSIRNKNCEIFLLAANDDKKTMAIAQEFGHEIKRLHVMERHPQQTWNEQLNLTVDNSPSPFVMFFDGNTPLSTGWDVAMLDIIRSSSKVGIVFPSPRQWQEKLTMPARENILDAIPQSFLVRRSAFIEGLGLHQKLNPAAATWNLLFQMQDLEWKIAFCSEALTEINPAAAGRLPAADAKFLKHCWPDYVERAATIAKTGSSNTASLKISSTIVDWIGSFLDHGSLSHVNREFTSVLQSSPEICLKRISNGASASPDFKHLAGEISAIASKDAAVTIRHAWPPDWKRPQTGKLVVIQPWEFGSLPEQWLKDSASVDQFWVPSEYVRRVYVESGVPDEKVVVVPNGVDLKKFHPQVAPMKLATQKKFKFLFVGGTIFRKGPDLLLKAYLENFTDADDICLVIKDFGGKTVYAGQTFESQIRAAQLQPNAPEILYLNQELPPDTLPGLYTACDCLVLPYRGEGFGLPALEAMAAGLPVIVTAGGATDDFVRDTFAWRIPADRKIFGHEISGMKLAGAGWLLEPDVAALGRFLREAFAKPAETRQRGQLAAQHAKQFCSWQNSAPIMARRIHELAGAGMSAGQLAQQQVSSTKTSTVTKAKITLPPCALSGHLAEARELVRQKKFRAAWEAALSALASRPFHPEAFLLLAEIAQSVGDGQSAKLCADHARRIAPGWKPARKFLNQRLKGGARPEWLKLPESLNSQPSTLNLSVCLIVKNEEKFLGQCLKSIREIASQIVVVDTGSTDRTVEIAKEFGAKIHAFAWCDDFSAARNAALEHATGDWVLVLDADEELSADGLDKLKLAMINPAVMAWRLPIVDVGREADGCSYVPRFFRNAPGLFYVGRVHEQVFSSIEVQRAEWGLENRIGDATLIHHGYTAEVTRDRNKIERNLNLLKRAVEELPDEPHLLMNLGLELARSGQEAGALMRYEEAFDTLLTKPATEIVPELRETFLMQFCARLTAAKRFDEVVRVLTSPLAGMHGGLTATLHFSLGLSYLELSRFSEGADQMRHCLAKRHQRSLAPINKEIHTAAPHHCLAMSLLKLGDSDGAEKAFQAGLTENGRLSELKVDYAKFLAAQNRPIEALQQLNELVQADAHNAVAWRLGGEVALSKPEFLEFARDWTGEAIRQLPDDGCIVAQRAEVLLLSQEIVAALPFWNRTINGERPPRAVAAQILCATASSQPVVGLSGRDEEIVVSRAFMDWYRRLVSVGARNTVIGLNSRVEILRPILPAAAGILDGVNEETRKNTLVSVSE
jgi:glycosyltransferase involved in cell wall biosynthesis/FMN phosphatase YigB (HAD superfamily)/Tfp pilus assembly protein PilF